jgi:hypothetical protein
VFTYHVRQDLPGDAKLVLTISDEAGRQVRRLDLNKTAGLRRIAWHLRADAPAAQPAAQAARAGAAGGGRAGQAGGPPAGAAGAQASGFGRGRPSAPVAAGRYQAVLGRLEGEGPPVGPRSRSRRADSTADLTVEIAPRQARPDRAAIQSTVGCARCLPEAPHVRGGLRAGRPAQLKPRLGRWGRV